MKSIISFFLENQMYKGKITSQRVENILAFYGFTLFEYDLNIDDDVLKILSSFDLTAYAKVVNCFTYVEDEYHKYVFIRSGQTEQDKIHMLFHEIGHIFYEHFSTKELIHNTSPTKERQADIFAFVQLFLNRISRALPCFLVAFVVIGILFQIFPYASSYQDTSQAVYYTQAGQVYHLYEDCYYLRNSVVISGSIEASGKFRVCAVCKNRAK